MKRMFVPLLLAGVTATSSIAQDDPSAAVSVSHDVVLTSTDGRSGHPVDARTLVALSNGMQVPILAVTESAPLSLVVLVDVTRSMSEAMASFVWDGLGSLETPRPSGSKPPDSPSDLLLQPLRRGVIRHLRPGDRVRLGRITNVPELGPGFTGDRASLERAAHWVVEPDDGARVGRTPLWDAVNMAVEALERERGRRRVVLLVTDGLATGNRFGLEEVTARAAHAGVSVFIVGEAWGTPRSGRGWRLHDATDAPWFMMKGAFTHPFDPLQRLARATGGVFLPDGERGAPDPGRHLASIIELLRASYSVTIRAPILPGESATLAIVSTDPAVQVHVRDRYRRDERN